MAPGTGTGQTTYRQRRKRIVLKSWHVHIEGQVQGVGFRPFIYQLARQHKLNGWVNNSVDGVHIAFNASQADAELFCRDAVQRAPVLARITSCDLWETEPQKYIGFQIVHSQSDGRKNLLLSPDFAVCPACRTELHDPGDRRFAYPFITCTHCGPRYSISSCLPYDRENTVMDHFTMCPSCHREYTDPDDRRYYAQTNSCPDCRITLSLIDREGNTLPLETDAIITEVVQLWQAGKIVAIKGIGGYLLTCDAANAATIQQLRRQKHRPTKPLAVMYPDITAIGEQLEVSPMAATELLSHRAPIVLLPCQAAITDQLALDELAPGLSKLGVMLPYTPLFEMLLQAFGRPIVATSGNVSHAPIIYTDDQAKAGLSGIADFLLSNNRAILIPQDDSVVQYSPLAGQKIVLRRSRGMAPTLLQPELVWPETSILASGALLKSTFSLLHAGNTYVSQYLGDLQHFDTEQSYQHCLQHLLQLLQIRPDLILCDSHPAYASTRFGQQMAALWGIPVEYVQHHHAHFGAILGEHRLFRQPEPVLGVIWDGTGLGDDQQIWGGEFFRYENYRMERCRHWGYFASILGDKMAKEPRISALALCHDLPAAAVYVRSKFSDLEWSLYGKMLEQHQKLQTSSVGRIFDAVASILGLGDRQQYEGEVAMRLEELAMSYVRQKDSQALESYFKEAECAADIPTASLIQALIDDLHAGKSIAYVAARFHYSLVHLIRLVAKQQQIRKIAFSGGVFQNALLVDLIIHQLSGDFQLYFHEELAPNDENISYGQLVCHYIRQLDTARSTQKSRSHVLSDSR